MRKQAKDNLKLTWVWSQLYDSNFWLPHISKTYTYKIAFYFKKQ